MLTCKFLCRLGYFELRAQLYHLRMANCQACCEHGDAKIVLLQEGDTSTLETVRMLKRAGLPRKVVRQMSRISLSGGSSSDSPESISPEVCGAGRLQQGILATYVKAVNAGDVFKQDLRI